MSISIIIVENVLKNSSKIASTAAIGVSGAAAGVIATKFYDQKIIREEKEKSFRFGLKKGAVIGKEATYEVFYNTILANVALSFYIAKIDGSISNEEQEIIDNKIKILIKNPELPEYIKKEIKKISLTKDFDFSLVKEYLNLLSTESIAGFMLDVYDIAKANEGISAEEKKAIENVEKYIISRMETDNKIETLFYPNIPFQSIDSVIDNKINKEFEAYSLKMRMLDVYFSRKTKLSAKEISLTTIATMLQCFRLYFINYATTIEKAGKKNIKENYLHKQQDRILKKFDKEYDDKPNKYYAPLNQIISSHGVPYDTTNFADNKLDIFKGANHRFATLGHDPIIGLVVGTANIMTNTITTVKENVPLPVTFHVQYDNRVKNPAIGEEASLVYAVNKIIDRSKKDITPLIAALIKQLIHIATDIYTPAGIQLPGANLLLSKENTELITKYINTGNSVKLSTSAGISFLINKIIEILHCCLLLENGENLESELSKVKTNKIILISESIASGSNLIKNSLTCKYDKLDWSGMIILFNQLFSDINFIFDLKREFISKGLGEIS